MSNQLVLPKLGETCLLLQSGTDLPLG